jgi:hypothetical protein
MFGMIGLPWLKQHFPSASGPGMVLYVDGTSGSDAGDGLTWATAYKTIAAAYAAAVAGDTIAIKGSFTEAVVSTKIGLRFVGIGTGPDEATWTAAADAICLTLGAADQEVSNIRFRPPAYTAGTPAAIKLHNAPYSRIIGNRFQGKTGSYYAIFCELDATHSSDNVLTQGNEFIYMNNITTVYGSAIVSTAVDGGYSCSSWRILDNDFNGCVAGIDLNARHCLVQGNIFRENGLTAAGAVAAVTGAAGSKKMFDLSGTSSGANTVTRNTFAATYSTTLFVVGASGDNWVGNFAYDAQTAAAGVTIAVPD